MIFDTAKTVLVQIRVGNCNVHGHPLEAGVFYFDAGAMSWDNYRWRRLNESS